jgi:hypothetical protein
MSAVGGYLGFITNGHSNGPLGTASLWLAKLTASQNAVATAVLIDTGNGAGANMRALVYDGTPSALLGSSAIVGSPPTAIVRFPLASSVNLTAGSSYHVGYIADGNPYLSYGGPAGAGVYKLGGQVAASPPNPISGVSVANNTFFVALELDGSSQTDNGFSPLDKSAGATLSSANAVATFSSVANQGVRSVTNRFAGRAYAEIVIGGTINNSIGVGICSANWTPSQGALQNYYYTYLMLPTGNVNANSGLLTYAAGDVIGVAWDANNNSLWWNKNNGAWFGASSGGNPAGNASGLNTVASAGWPMGIAVATGATGTAATFTLRDTLGALQYAPPAGFVPWVNYLNYLQVTQAAVEEWVQIPNSPPLVMTQAGVEMWATNVPIIPGGGGAKQARAMVMA